MPSHQAGAYDKKYLIKATNLFENMLSYGNHLHMFSEEIARSGEQLGNTPQAFSHLALISAAFNLGWWFLDYLKCLLRRELTAHQTESQAVREVCEPVRRALNFSD